MILLQEKNSVEQIVFPVFLGLLLNEDQDVVDYPGCTVSIGLSNTTLFVDDCEMPNSVCGSGHLQFGRRWEGMHLFGSRGMEDHL